METMSLFVVAACIFVGMCSGIMIAHMVIEPRYERLLDETINASEAKCLKTITKNYVKEQSTRKLLLHELGEALDVDVVHLPSFGYVLLKDAFEVPEDVVESVMGYDIS